MADANKPAEQAKIPEANQDVVDITFKEAGVTAILVLALLVAAILIPDYWNYQLKRDLIRSVQGQIVETNDTQVVTNQLPDQIDIPARAVSSVNSQPNVSVTSSDIFETYGKLITMLLGFISVVGIFCGYFLRKSVRELTEDVRHDVEAQIKIFDRERELALKEAKAAEDSAKQTLARTEKLAKEYEAVLTTAAEKLGALDEAIRRYQERPQQPIPEAGALAARVDEAMKGEGV